MKYIIKNQIYFFCKKNKEVLLDIEIELLQLKLK